MKKTIAAITAAVMMFGTASLCAADENELPLVPVSGDSVKQTSWRIGVENILQKPELPAGCEVTSLAMVLRYLGYNADKMTLAREYLPKQEIRIEDGKWYGPDFKTTFAGDPEKELNSYGCYAPCIVSTADDYFKKNGLTGHAEDISGTAFDVLLDDYISNDKPVIVWVTSGGLSSSWLSDSWITPSGDTVQWRSPEHCVVLTGYDLNEGENGVVYVSDPLDGDTSFDMSLFRQRYEEMGSYAVYVSKEKGKTVFAKGDVNADRKINVTDIVQIAAFIKGKRHFDDETFTRADVNNDKKINVTDIVRIAAFIKGKGKL